MTDIQHELFHDIGRRAVFAKVMGDLEVAFSRKPSTLRVDAYWRHLHKVDAPVIARIATLHITEVGKFPSIADFLKTATRLGTTRRKRGQFTRVAGLYCENCGDTGWRFLAGSEQVNGSPITVDERREYDDKERGRGWVFRAQPCPCRENNPNYQCEMDERTSKPPDIDRDRAGQMMRSYLPHGKGKW